MKLSASDPEWLDIEYGQDTPEKIHQPVDIATINPEAMAYYDKVWAVYHDWVRLGRSKRDCLVAELLARQDGDTGTVRGISIYLKSKQFKRHTKSMVESTIKEINEVVLGIGQRHPIVEQAFKRPSTQDSKPLEEEASGKTNHDDQDAYPRVA